MSLLSPLSLAALVAIPLIILLHMRHITPPRRHVASLRFWQAADPRPAESRRLRRPPLTLPLLLQIAAAALLAFALARPATAAQLSALAPGLYAAPRHLIVLLDGSTSMGAAVAPGETRWDAARAAVQSQLAPLREGDVATVLLLGARPQTFTAADNAGLVSLRDRLAALPLPGGRANLDAALELASDLVLPNLRREIVVISDGAATVDPTVVSLANAPVALIVPGGDAAAARENAAIVDIAARPDPDGNGAMGLSVTAVNFGARDLVVPMVLLGDGLEIGRTNVTLAASGEPRTLQWLLPPGITQLTARLEQTDALPADDSATLLLNDASDAASIAPQVLLISDLPGALARALLSIDALHVAVEARDNTAAMTSGGYDLIVFDRTAPPADVLAQITTPTLWIAPPQDGPFAASEEVTDPTVNRLRAGDPLLDGVDLAGVTFGPTPVFVRTAGDEEIVGSSDGPLLFRSQLNGQPALVLTSDPETSNLTKRVSFPILVANMVAALAPNGIPGAIPLGEPLVYEPRAAAQAITVTPPKGEPERIAVAATDSAAGVARDVVFSNTGVPGAYTVTELAAGDQPLGSAQFVVNAGHLQESDLRLNQNLAATLAAASGSDVNAARQERVDLWPLLAVFALGVIVLEWLAILWSGRMARRPTQAAAG